MNALTALVSMNSSCNKPKVRPLLFIFTVFEDSFQVFMPMLHMGRFTMLVSYHPPYTSATILKALLFNVLIKVFMFMY